MSDPINTHSCSHCSLNKICLPLGVDRHDLKKLESLVKNEEVQRSGDIAYRQGDAFQKIYAVKSGMYKSIALDAEGHEHVSGFHLPGELIGLEAIYPGAYSATTVALTTSALCEFNYDELTELSLAIPALQRQLLRLFSKEISHPRAVLMEHTAEQKLAGFINNLAKRYEMRGYSGRKLMLVMKRQDIANHLGMAAETISRLLKRLQSQGIVRIDNRDMTILDEAALLRAAGCEPSPVSEQTLNKL